LIWAQEQNEERSPNLTRFTEHFNKMSYWWEQQPAHQPTIIYESVMLAVASYRCMVPNKPFPPCTQSQSHCVHLTVAFYMLFACCLQCCTSSFCLLVISSEWSNCLCTCYQLDGADVVSEDCHLLGCYAIWLLYEPTSQRNVLPPSSGWQESVS
jgi:hypothetical protein